MTAIRVKPDIVLPGGGPGDADRFFLPEYFLWDQARRMGVPITRLLGHQYAGGVAAVDDMGHARDLAYRLGGRAERPKHEVVILGPDGRTPIVLAGWGVTEAAELEEVAIEALEVNEKRMRERGALVDFEELRERNGLPSGREAGEKIKEAIAERARRHLANPITDPARQPNKPRGYVPGADLKESA